MAEEGSSPHQPPDFRVRIQEELRFFSSEEIREAFRGLSITPYEVTMDWDYGKKGEQHKCWVIAQDPEYRIVYCPTGFGPAFPWGALGRNAHSMGMDDRWFAYLFEAFISGPWNGPIPKGFAQMGPGEREEVERGGKADDSRK